MKVQSIRAMFAQKRGGHTECVLPVCLGFAKPALNKENQQFKECGCITVIETILNKTTVSSANFAYVRTGLLNLKPAIIIWLGAGGFKKILDWPE